MEGATFIYQTKQQKSRTLGSEQREEERGAETAEPVSGRSRASFQEEAAAGDVAVEGSAGSRVRLIRSRCSRARLQGEPEPKEQGLGCEPAMGKAATESSAEFRAIALHFSPLEGRENACSTVAAPPSVL